MKQLNYLLVVLAATLYLGCTPPERVDNGGNNSDDIENNGGGGNDGNGNNGGTENPSKPTTSAPYEVGDYYNESGKEGIVIEVDQDGNNGKIISLRQSPTPLQWASDVAEQNRLVGTIYMSGGVENLAKIVKIPNWKEKYPAFKWCFDYGKGWYLPALQEVEKFIIFPAIRETINKGLKENGGTPITTFAYWSSTEWQDNELYGAFRAYYVNAASSKSLTNDKKYKFYVRAVASFGDWYDDMYKDVIEDIYDNPNNDDNGGDDNGGGGDNNGGGSDDNNGDNNGDGGDNNPNNPSNPNPDPDNPNPNPDDPDPDNPNPNPGPDNPDDDTPGGGDDDDSTGGGLIGTITKGPYEVGDYYNDGENEGVVFYVTDHGTHGKIVSKATEFRSWATSNCSIVVSATSSTDGAYNMAKIREISGWESYFPAFKYCADRGEGWYLPSIGEMGTIYSLRDLINSKMQEYFNNVPQNGSFFNVCSWSSTESDEKNAVYVNMDGTTTTYMKSISHRVHPIYAF